jgi:CubicO group peptidase (beta-lactamase class C family)
MATLVSALTPAWAQTSPDSISAESESHIRAIEAAIAGPVRVTGVDFTPPTLTERMRQLNVPGVSVAFFRDGKIEWARGFGVMATAGDKRGAPVTVDTLFQAGSISKPVSAIAALKLVEAGKLDLDANVNGYLKGWKVPDNAFTQDKKVTLRGLLTHTAGLTVHGFPGYARGEAVPTLTQILDSKRPANTSAIRVDTVPGSKWRYSGGGYVVMQKLLEDVTGKKFEVLAKETVLTPMGMTASTFAQPLPTALRKFAATPYDSEGVAVLGGAHTYPEMTAAGLWTTASDLARYAINVQASLAGKGGVLKAETARAMLTRSDPGKWGLGPELGGSDAKPWFGHGGVDEGFVANLTAYNDGDGVAIMTNGMGSMRLASDIRASIAREYGWPDFKPKVRAAVMVAAEVSKRHAGAYRLGPYSVMRVAQEGARLFATNIEGEKNELFAASDNVWFRADADIEYRFETDRLVFKNGGGRDEIRVRLSDAQAAQIAGALAARVKTQKPQAGAQGALRKSIAGLASGEPDYTIYNEAMAAVTKQQLPALKNLITGMGAVKSVAFLRVEADGQDVYKVKYANGDTDWRIVLDEDGKIAGIGF